MTEQNADAASRHAPVLLERCVELLVPALEAPGSVLVDCTLGMGGHTAAVLDAAPHARVIGLDRDPEAIALASERLAGYGERFVAVRAVYDDLPSVLAEQGLDAVQGVLMDLGVSSLQLDEAERGFSYAQDAPLDMRMDQSAGRTAADVLATYTEAELTRVLREWGEERFAPRIARRIVTARDAAPLTRTGELVEIVRAAVPAATRHTGGTRPSARSRRCASRSTASSRCSPGPCPPPSRRSPWAGASSSSRTTPSRTGSSSASSRAGRRRAPRRACPSSPRRTAPT